MKNQHEMTEAQRLVATKATYSALESLHRNGFIKYDTKKGVLLKVKPSHAFMMAVHPATETVEAICLYLELLNVMSENGFKDLLYDLARVVFLSLQGCRLAAVPWPLPKWPDLEPEPELAASVLGRLLALESEGRI